MTPDSGTTFMTMPTWAHDLFIEKTFAPEMSCNENLEEFGTITFVINEKHYDIDSHHWVRRKIDNHNYLGGRCSDMFRE